MRIAILSDIHGNLMALDAVMTDLESQSPDEIWCGGDIGWGGPWASECIARVRSEGWTSVKGNTDIWITGDPQTVDTPEDRAIFNQLAAIHDVSKEDARWLASLPLGHHPAGSILLVHGTPLSPFQGPMPDAPAKEFRVFEDQAKFVVYGHVHHAFSRRLTGGTLLVNTGSVGFPEDEERASYLIIDRDGPDISWQHRRVEYDRRAVIAEAKRQPEPLRSRLLARLKVAE
ncbi:MAG: metallophosphoesterase family protein [Actinomycetota bacterium]